MDPIPLPVLNLLLSIKELRCGMQEVRYDERECRIFRLTTPHLDSSGRCWTNPPPEKKLFYNTHLYLSLIRNWLGLVKAMRRPIVIITVTGLSPGVKSFPRRNKSNDNHGCGPKILTIWGSKIGHSVKTSSVVSIENKKTSRRAPPIRDLDIHIGQTKRGAENPDILKHHKPIPIEILLFPLKDCINRGLKFLYCDGVEA